MGMCYASNMLIGDFHLLVFCTYAPIPTSTSNSSLSFQLGTAFLTPPNTHSSLDHLKRIKPSTRELIPPCVCFRHNETLTRCELVWHQLDLRSYSAKHDGILSATPACSTSSSTPSSRTQLTFGRQKIARTRAALLEVFVLTDCAMMPRLSFTAFLDFSLPHTTTVRLFSVMSSPRLPNRRILAPLTSLIGFNTDATYSALRD